VSLAIFTFKKLQAEKDETFFLTLGISHMSKKKFMKKFSTTYHEAFPIKLFKNVPMIYVKLIFVKVK